MYIIHILYIYIDLPFQSCRFNDHLVLVDVFRPTKVEDSQEKIQNKASWWFQPV